MAICNIHSQTYEVAKGEVCIYCGDPDDYLHPLSEVCKRLHICRKTATAWFTGEEGVVQFPGSGYNPRKKKNVTLRIPGRVIKQVLKQFANKPVRRIS